MTYPLTTGDLVSAADWNSLHHAIETLSLGSGVSVTFTSIPQTFRHLVLEARGILDTATSDIAVQFNGDTGSTAYERFLWRAKGDGTTTVSTSFGASQISVGTWGNVPNCSMRLTVPSYTETLRKTVRSEATLQHPSITANQMITFGTGRWDTSDAVTSLTFRTASGSVNFGDGEATLYGIP